ncbi:MAG: glycosyltransferase family 9 protein, partial [Calditrichia bacterium]
LEVPVFDEDREFVSDFLAQNNISDKDLLIGLNPGAFRSSRCWFNERWAQLADWLIEEYGSKVIITGGESEREMINEIVNSMKKKSAIIATDFTLKQLAALLEKLNLFITNDTGPMHIATAMQTPLIAIFGPGDVYRVPPYCQRDRAVILRKDVDCERPCYQFKCNDRKCMELITTDDVIKAVKRTLT